MCNWVLAFCFSRLVFCPLSAASGLLNFLRFFCVFSYRISCALLSFHFFLSFFRSWLSFSSFFEINRAVPFIKSDTSIYRLILNIESFDSSLSTFQMFKWYNNVMTKLIIFGVCFLTYFMMNLFVRDQRK